MILFGGKTDFSIGQSIYKPKALVNDALKAGYSALAIADTSNINALPIVFSQARDTDLKVIYGVSVAVVQDLTYRPKKKSLIDTFFVNIFVVNNDGFKELTHLLSNANDSEHFFHQPRISFEEMITAIQTPNWVITMGDTVGVHSLASYNDIAARMASVCKPFNNLFVELIALDTAYYLTTLKRSIQTAETHGLQCVLSRPTLHMAGAEEIRTTMDCIINRATVDSTWARHGVGDASIIKPADLLRLVIDLAKKAGVPSTLFGHLSKAVKNSSELESRFSYAWNKMEISLPHLADDPYQELVLLAKVGWKERLMTPMMGYQPPKELLPEYVARLKYELGILRDMGFESYFLLVQELVRWARDNDIMVGPGRGSAGGSLVSYLLGITDVDPIRFGLIFERFINPERLDLPDIDLDFMSSRTEEIIYRLSDIYGEEFVSGISNYVMLGAASSFRDVSKANGVPDYELGVSKQIKADRLEEAVEMTAGLSAYAIQHPKEVAQAIELQGNLRNYGKHAAGVIVAGVPIRDRGVVQTKDGHAIVNWDKRVCDDFGLVKLDVLSLSNLDMLTLGRDYLKEQGIPLDYLRLPLDDKEVLAAFGRGDTAGVFQFESSGMRGLLTSLSDHGGIDLTFEDLAAATALFRPGPLDSGLTEDFKAIKGGRRDPEYIHDSMIPALEETYSVIVYQEQVMKIARDTAGFTMAEADHLRKAMGKKDPVKMAAMREQWVNGCVNTSGIHEDTAAHLFDIIEKFAGYGFNKSHAVAYTVISYWTMYLKTKYPSAFYAAALTILDEDKRINLIRDVEKLDILVMPPNINESTFRFEIGYDDKRDKQVLYAPFQVIKGLSERASGAILRAREGGRFTSFDHFVSQVERRLCNKSGQEKLRLVGAFAHLEPETLDARHPDRLKDQKILMPGLISGEVKAERIIELSPFVLEELQENFDAWQKAGEVAFGKIDYPMPRIGRKPKMMIITDYPTWKECKAGRMGEGDIGDAIKLALKGANLNMNDVYITALVKCGKEKDEEITNEHIKTFLPFLQKEIELTSPPVIICLGTKASRTLNPDLKGSYEEIIGLSTYSKEFDATLIYGFNPAMLFHRPHLQGELDKIMLKVADVVM